jgi:CcmD family protein
MTTLKKSPVLLALLLWLTAGPALAAEEYEPVNQATRELTDPNPYILGAYGVIWAAVLVYVVMVARGLTRARAEIETLRRRVDRT